VTSQGVPRLVVPRRVSVSGKYDTTSRLCAAGGAELQWDGEAPRSTPSDGMALSPASSPHNALWTSLAKGASLTVKNNNNNHNHNNHNNSSNNNRNSDNNNHNYNNYNNSNNIIINNSVNDVTSTVSKVHLVL